MKAEAECYLCLLSQVLRTAGVLGLKDQAARELTRQACAFLAGTDFNRTPPEISEDLYNLIAGFSGNSDPYQELKVQHIRKALELYPGLKKLALAAPDPIRSALEISLAGNVIDFGANSGEDWLLEGRFLQSEPLALDDYQLLKADLDRAGKIVFLGDNAGETVFDRLLIEISGRRVIYAVREKPIINDATLEEARASGLEAVAELVSSGCLAPGTVFEECSPEFQGLLREADLIISKGQGNFECLEQLPGPFYFLLKAKCQVVARYLDVPQGSLIIMRSRNFLPRLKV
ncbi:MAG: damage-control phosphatase ARMT1 family protein [Candidatus Saccharicenans sp.]|uniref:damage-control phosphatase ARMT1 family protein n=1 Tax=Candidatus Saccharicenans sp. TaxID=2819258 RepID=UPI00404A8FB0